MQDGAQSNFRIHNYQRGKRDFPHAEDPKKNVSQDVNLMFAINLAEYFVNYDMVHGP